MGWEKVACWSTKAAISLKRVNIEEKLTWRAYRNSPTLFRTVPYHLRPPLPLDWGSQPPPKTPIVLSRERVKIQTANLAGTFKGPSEQNPLKMLEKSERGRIQELLKIFEYPY